MSILLFLLTIILFIISVILTFISSVSLIEYINHTFTFLSRKQILKNTLLSFLITIIFWLLTILTGYNI